MASNQAPPTIMSSPLPNATPLVNENSANFRTTQATSFAAMTNLRQSAVKLRLPVLILAHAAIFSLAYWLAFCLRFDFDIPQHWQAFYLSSLPWLVAIELSCFYCFGTFNGWWRYFTFRDLLSLVPPLIISFLIFGVLNSFVFEIHAPRSVHLLNTALAGILIGGLRSIWRISKEGLWTGKRDANCKSVMMICNNNESAILAHQINNRFQSKIRILGILSDSPNIVGVKRAGMSVLGSPLDAPSLAKTCGSNEVWVVAGDVDGRELNILKQWYDQHDLVLKVIPGSADWGSGDGRIPLREININDLLQREPVQLDTELIGGEIEGKRVLVTGAGGSIGSEICRQLIQFQPAELILVDHRENSVFLIHNELKRNEQNDTTLHPAVGDILDERRMRALFQQFQPEYVYHAAAHKHVGLMEISSGEAIKNNVLGTRRVAEISDEHNVKKFVLVSTDKAVNPTSMMGCTKHIAERFVLSLAQKSQTSFV
ncbi:MAG: polysaccharide biosynthesis protein, partial [Planctomycetaceae bacterium]|nr:polysaccharide biosynthesis protein [Planctomycetaceae bacterium]